MVLVEDAAASLLPTVVALAISKARRSLSTKCLCLEASSAHFVNLTIAMGGVVSLVCGVVKSSNEDYMYE